MTIEYKISFVKGEWIITQRVNPAATGSVAVPNGPTATIANPGTVIANEVPEVFPGSTKNPSTVSAKKGGGPEDEAGPGGGGRDGGPAPVVIFGPIVLCGATPGGMATGGGPEDSASAGGGAH
jgi:hypothetical protein